MDSIHKHITKAKPHPVLQVADVGGDDALDQMAQLFQALTGQRVSPEELAAVAAEGPPAGVVPPARRSRRVGRSQGSRS